MTDITPSKEYTFTVNKVPAREASRKTLIRLMQMQPSVKKGLSNLQRKRKLTDNIFGIRAGRPWINRKRATKIVWLEKGAQFTITVTPQLVNDVKSVQKYLDVA